MQTAYASLATRMMYLAPFISQRNSIGFLAQKFFHKSPVSVLNPTSCGKRFSHFLTTSLNAFFDNFIFSLSFSIVHGFPAFDYVYSLPYFYQKSRVFLNFFSIFFSFLSMKNLSIHTQKNLAKKGKTIKGGL